MAFKRSAVRSRLAPPRYISRGYDDSSYPFLCAGGTIGELGSAFPLKKYFFETIPLILKEEHTPFYGQSNCPRFQSVEGFTDPSPRIDPFADMIIIRARALLRSP